MTKYRIKIRFVGRTKTHLGFGIELERCETTGLYITEQKFRSSSELDGFLHQINLHPMVHLAWIG